MQTFILYVVLTAPAVCEANNKNHEKLSKELEKKYEALRRAEKEAHLAEEEADAKERAIHSYLAVKEARVQKAKDDLRIKRAEVRNDARAVAKAVAHKEKESKIETMDEESLKSAKKQVLAAQKATGKLEQHYNQTTVVDGLDFTNLAAMQPSMQGQPTIVVVHPPGGGRPGIPILTFVFFAGIGTAMLHSMVRQWGRHPVLRAVDDPMSRAAFQADYGCRELSGSCVDALSKAPVSETTEYYSIDRKSVV